MYVLITSYIIINPLRMRSRVTVIVWCIFFAGYRSTRVFDHLKAANEVYTDSMGRNL